MPSDGKHHTPCRAFGSLTFLLADDVLKARLKTVGVSEYKFEMEVSAGRDSGTEWRIVDVGGSRSQVRIFCPNRHLLSPF
jgi:guanine nucleotide-binding protein subunit alpha